MSIHPWEPQVVKTGKGRVVNRGIGKYIKAFIYIPKDVATDSAFPFKFGEEVQVTIEGDRLIISKISKK